MTKLAKILSRAALAAMAIGMASSAMAATITYTLTGFGQARIGTVLNVSNFVATGIADTSTLNFNFGATTPATVLSSFTIVFGSNVYTATNTIRFFDNQGNGIFGFNDVATQDVLDFQAAAFNSYDAISNIGPLPVAHNYNSVLATNAGLLNFLTPPTNLVFQAVVGAVPAVPEPAS